MAIHIIYGANDPVTEKKAPIEFICNSITLNLSPLVATCSPIPGHPRLFASGTHNHHNLSCCEVQVVNCCLDSQVQLSIRHHFVPLFCFWVLQLRRPYCYHRKPAEAMRSSRSISESFRSIAQAMDIYIGGQAIYSQDINHIRLGMVGQHSRASRCILQINA